MLGIERLWYLFAEMPKPRRYVISPLPWWSKKIRDMRENSGLSQSAFAERLKSSSMSVSRWERGLVRPAADCLIKIGEMAGPRVGLQFWKMAGISPSLVKRMLASNQKKNKEGKRR